MENFVLDAIKHITAEGKSPSVALIKSHLSQKVPMPVIIQVLGKFKQNPDIISHIGSSANRIENTSEISQLDRIEQKLDRLLSMLESQGIK